MIVTLENGMIDEGQETVKEGMAMRKETKDRGPMQDKISSEELTVTIQAKELRGWMRNRGN